MDDKFYQGDCYEKSPQEKVVEYHSLIEEIDAEIAKKELMKESLMASMIRSVKSITTPFSIFKETLSSAAKQQNEKLKENRADYEFAKGKIIELFFRGDKTAKLTRITAEGWESYAYWFYVEYKGINFCIKIPDVKKATENTLKHMNRGMYSVSYQKTPSWTQGLAVSYKEEDIANAIDEFLKQRDIDKMEVKKETNILDVGLEIPEIPDYYER